MRAPDWFPDWAGSPAVIAGLGPSLDKAALEYARAKGARVIVVNGAWKYAPWADVLYAADWVWWAHYGPDEDQFDGIRVRASDATKADRIHAPPYADDRVLGTVKVRIDPHQGGALRWEGDYVGNGGNGGFQAANLAPRFGADPIILAGIDCDAPESRVDGLKYRHGGRSSQSKSTIQTWRDAWMRAAPIYRARGVHVINTSTLSRVECFPQMSMMEALRCVA